MTHQFSTHTITRRLFTLAAAPLFAITITACSDSPLASVPLSPSALPSSGAALDTADASAVTGNWATLGKGNGKENGNGGDKGKGHDATTVEIEGTVATATGTCPTKTVTIGTRSFATSAATVYDEGTCAQLVATAAVEVKATTQADGTLLATKVEFEGADEDEDALTEVEGPVATVTGTCPAITVTVTGKPSVVTSATTEFRKGVCADVQPGTRVHIRGTLQANGTVAATRVDIKKGEDEDADDDESRNPHDGPGPFDGTVSELTGVCPAVTFNLRGMEIVTSATTTFVGGTCATLQPNVQVVVTGTRVGETRTINATRIEITRTH
jgi:hypothetical protein